MCRRSSRFFFLFSLLYISWTTSKQIPLIGLFTRDEATNHSMASSSLIIDYALKHLKAVRNLHTELIIQRQDEDIPCDMAIGTKLIFDMIHRTPRPLAIFSGSCQTVASAIAETAGIYDMTIVQISSMFFLDRTFFFLFSLLGRSSIQKPVHCSRRGRSIRR